MEKEMVQKFDLEAAFRALDEIEAPKTKGLKANRVDLKERFAAKAYGDALVEDYYNVNDKEALEEAKEDREEEVAKAKLARIEKIVDLDAESPEDLLPSYVGKVIIQCPQCMTLFYKNPEDIEKSEENPDVVNINEICQHCGNASGYTLIGKVGKVSEDEAANYEAAEEGTEEDELSLDFGEPTEEVSPEGTGGGFEEEEIAVEEGSEDSSDDELDLEAIDLEPTEESLKLNESLTDGIFDIPASEFKELGVDDDNWDNGAFRPGWAVEIINNVPAANISFHKDAKTAYAKYFVIKNGIDNGDAPLSWDTVRLWKLGKTDEEDKLLKEYDGLVESLKEGIDNELKIEIKGEDNFSEEKINELLKKLNDVFKKHGIDANIRVEKTDESLKEDLVIDNFVSELSKYTEALEEGHGLKEIKRETIMAVLYAILSGATTAATATGELPQFTSIFAGASAAVVALKIWAIALALKNKKAVLAGHEAVKELLKTNKEFKKLIYDLIDEVSIEKAAEIVAAIEKVIKENPNIEIKDIKKLTDKGLTEGIFDASDDELKIEIKGKDDFSEEEINKLLKKLNDVFKKYGIEANVRVEKTEESLKLNKKVEDTKVEVEAEEILDAAAKAGKEVAKEAEADITEAEVKEITDKVITKELGLPVAEEGSDDSSDDELDEALSPEQVKQKLTAYAASLGVEEGYKGTPEERTTHLEYTDDDPTDGKAVLPNNIEKQLTETSVRAMRDTWTIEESSILKYYPNKHQVEDYINKAKAVELAEAAKGNTVRVIIYEKFSRIPNDGPYFQKMGHPVKICYDSIENPEVVKIFVQNNLMLEEGLDEAKSISGRVNYNDEGEDFAEGYILKVERNSIDYRPRFTYSINTYKKEIERLNNYFKSHFDRSRGKTLTASENENLTENKLAEGIYDVSDAEFRAMLKDKTFQEFGEALTEEKVEESKVSTAAVKKAVSEINAIGAEDVEEDINIANNDSPATADDAEYETESCEGHECKEEKHVCEKCEDLHERSLNKHISAYLTEVYANVKDFTATNCSLNGDKLVIEGTINFNSGKSRATKFEFTEAKNGEAGKIVLEGHNKDLAEDARFTLDCSLEDGGTCLLTEGFGYKYTINGTLVEGLK